jgi:fructose/tagatose bisphosphate aldolase
MFEEGHVEMLAVSVGSVHGKKSRLNLTLLKEIAAVGKGPLVCKWQRH